MNTSKPWLALSFTLLCATAVHAADTGKPAIVRDYTDVVAPAEQQAYETGIKNYNQCLQQHGFKYTWKAWVHETGNTYSYSYVSDPLAWASFDAMAAAGKACDGQLRSAVNPHLQSETSAFMEMMPDMSHMPQGKPPASAFIEVTFFKLKPGHQADEAFTAAVIPANSWAEVGKDPDPSVWKMVENVYGKEAAQALRKSINDAIQDSSAHVDSYNADLTYTAAGD
jgi:hypothetical protein